MPLFEKIQEIKIDKLFDRSLEYVNLRTKDDYLWYKVNTPKFLPVFSTSLKGKKTRKLLAFSSEATGRWPRPLAQ